MQGGTPPEAENEYAADAGLSLVLAIGLAIGFGFT
jgi:hypothetical protein